MSSFTFNGPRTPAIDRLVAFAERASETLYLDDRVRIMWLTGSLATGTADAQSDVDLRVAIRPEDFLTIDNWWQELIAQVASTVWKRRWPGPPQDIILGAISTEYIGFDIVAQSAADTNPRTYEAVAVLFDKDNLAPSINLTASSPDSDPLANLPIVVEEFIRLLGMLPIVIGRKDIPIGMEGHFVCQSLLISLLMMENGIDRMKMGKRHVAAFLTDEQRALLSQLPPLASTLDSITNGRLAYARVFLPRARRLMELKGLDYPEVFEAATVRHLQDSLGVQVY